jgi:hypothetical protein
VADKDDDLLDSVNAMADRLKLTGKDRSRYVHEHMTRSGYRAVPQYVKDDSDDEDDGGSGFFSSGRRKRSSRDGGDQRRGRDRDDDDDWYS